MEQSNNSKRLRVDAKLNSQAIGHSNDSQQKKSLKLNWSAYMDHVFCFLSLIDLSHCQQLNKLWQKHTKKAIRSDAKTYALIRVKQKKMHIGDIRDYPLTSVDQLVLKYIKRTDDKDEMINSIDSQIQLLEDTDNTLSNLFKKEECVKYIMDNLVFIAKVDKHDRIIKHKLKIPTDCKNEEFKYDPETFISIEYPSSINSTSTRPRTVITAEQLLLRAGLEKQEKGLSQKKWVNESNFQRCLDYVHGCYFEHSLEREVMKIILSNAKVSQYFDDVDKHNKNLLLLDWDNTLYWGNSQRPHLIEFLKCATKYCVIFINTWGCSKEWEIHQLNNNDGVHISGVFNQSRQKKVFNLWIKNFHWFNIDEKHFNFLLIDDRNERCSNFIQVAAFQGDQNDDVLLKLIPWLKKWYQYTSVDKQGTTNQFIKSYTKFDEKWRGRKCFLGLTQPDLP